MPAGPLIPRSGHIAFFDETGDHGLANIDPHYPLFLLSCCVFDFAQYAAVDSPRILALKHRYFGHDGVVLHSHKIRKQLGPFKILADPAVKADFMAEMAAIFQGMTGTIIAGAIDKPALKARYRLPGNPYELAMTFCLERLFAHLRRAGAADATTVCVFECRGAAEDRELELVFRRVVAGANRWGTLPFDIH